MRIKAHLDVNELPDSETCHPHLTPNKVYPVIGIEDNYFRIVDDDFEPILYPKKLFSIVDSSYPDSWIKTEYNDGEYYIDPPELSEQYFYEDYFDGVENVVLVYKNYLKKLNTESM